MKIELSAKQLGVITGSLGFLIEEYPVSSKSLNLQEIIDIINNQTTVINI